MKRCPPIRFHFLKYFFIALLIFVLVLLIHVRYPNTEQLVASTNVPSLYILNDSNSHFVSNISIKDVIITVKTTKRNHKTRLGVILNTWFRCAPNQIYFFTDTNDPETQKATENHLIESKCNPTHSRSDLCCKTGSEFEFFFKRHEKWWCEFDDDNYVNVDRLVNLLKQFNPDDLILIGRRSRKHSTTKKNITFWFPTGGAGVCLSRALVKMVAPWFMSEKIAGECKKAKVTDDMLIGYVITGILKMPLYESLQLHSHLENLKRSMKGKDLRKEISFSYYEDNVTPFYIHTPAFNRSQDPTRFLSLHQLLHAHDSSCL